MGLERIILRVVILYLFHTSSVNHFFFCISVKVHQVWKYVNVLIIIKSLYKNTIKRRKQTEHG